MASLSRKSAFALTPRLPRWSKAAAVGLSVALAATDQAHKALWASLSPPMTSSGLHLILSGFFLLIALGGLWRARSRWVQIAWAFLLAGGVSNSLDRVVRGAVVDPLRIGALYFNLADILIVSSLIFLFIYSLLARRYDLR
jgi:lipoprotein signal peptidase